MSQIERLTCANMELRTDFDCVAAVKPYYSDGPIQLAPKVHILCACLDNCVSLVDLRNGIVIRTISAVYQYLRRVLLTTLPKSYG